MADGLLTPEHSGQSRDLQPGPAPTAPPATPAATPDLAAFLRTVTADRGLHVRWLNTLSLLEFMGARKIARSAQAKNLDETFLRHLAEEARHAHFFKRMALRIQATGDATNGDATSDNAALPDNLDRTSADPRDLTYAPRHLLAPAAAARYFHGLDAAVRRALGLKRGATSFAAYLYVTTLIEERAGVVYELYESILREAGAPVRLSGIIGEEDRHLEEMQADLARIDRRSAERLDELRNLEAWLFARFTARLESAVAAAA